MLPLTQLLLLSHLPQACCDPFCFLSDMEPGCDNSPTFPCALARCCHSHGDLVKEPLPSGQKLNSNIPQPAFGLREGLGW